MKLAEALQERADLNKKIEQLRSRITSNALMQEGVLPVEDPEQLLKELDECLNQLEKLIIVINKTNMAVVSEYQLSCRVQSSRTYRKQRGKTCEGEQYKIIVISSIVTCAQKFFIVTTRY